VYNETHIFSLKKRKKEKKEEEEREIYATQ
jgi:hypothetical protein